MRFTVDRCCGESVGHWSSFATSSLWFLISPASFHSLGPCLCRRDANERDESGLVGEEPQG